MISQIGIDEFRKRLELNTKLGNPKISGTPFHAFNMVGEKNKLFFGRLNQNDFKITSNAYHRVYLIFSEIHLKKTNIMNPKFEAGINIAIKIPKSKFEKTVAFYRDILKLEVEEKPISNPTVSRTFEVKFGHNIIWLDCVDNYTHSETWLQLTVPNVEEATSYLESNGVETCDEIEEIPKNMHWIQDPAGTVFNLQQRQRE